MNRFITAFIVFNLSFVSSTNTTTTTTTTHPPGSQACTLATGGIVWVPNFQSLIIYQWLDCDPEKYLIFTAVASVIGILLFIGAVIGMCCWFKNRSRKMREDFEKSTRGHGFDRFDIWPISKLTYLKVNPSHKNLI